MEMTQAQHLVFDGVERCLGYERLGLFAHQTHQSRINALL